MVFSKSEIPQMHTQKINIFRASAAGNLFPQNTFRSWNKKNAFSLLGSVHTPQSLATRTSFVGRICSAGFLLRQSQCAQVVALSEAFPAEISPTINIHKKNNNSKWIAGKRENEKSKPKPKSRENPKPNAASERSQWERLNFFCRWNFYN